MAQDTALLAKLARAEIDIIAFEMQEQRVISALSTGQSPGTAAPMLKIRGSELIQRLDELAIEALGPLAAWDSAEASVALGRYLYDRSITIYGGTSEILRNILARSVLAM